MIGRLLVFISWASAGLAPSSHGTVGFNTPLHGVGDNDGSIRRRWRGHCPQLNLQQSP